MVLAEAILAPHLGRFSLSNPSRRPFSTPKDQGQVSRGLLEDGESRAPHLALGRGHKPGLRAPQMAQPLQRRRRLRLGHVSAAVLCVVRCVVLSFGRAAVLISLWGSLSLCHAPCPWLLSSLSCRPGGRAHPAYDGTNVRRKLALDVGSSSAPAQEALEEKGEAKEELAGCPADKEGVPEPPPATPKGGLSPAVPFTLAVLVAMYISDHSKRRPGR